MVSASWHRDELEPTSMACRFGSMLQVAPVKGSGAVESTRQPSTTLKTSRLNGKASFIEDPVNGLTPPMDCRTEPYRRSRSTGSPVVWFFCEIHWAIENGM